MDDVDRHAAARALVDWFQSQDIMPADATLVMSTVVAEQLVAKTQNVIEIERAVNKMRQLLLLDCAEWLLK